MIHYELKKENGSWLADVLIAEKGIIAAVTDYGNFVIKFNAFSYNFNEFILSLDTHYFGKNIIQQGNHNRETAMFISEQILPLLQEELKNKKMEQLKEIFTDEFLNNQLPLVGDFNLLDIKHDRTWYYESGEILEVNVELNDKNKEILSKYIKDFDKYNALVEEEYFKCEEGKTDLIYIIHFVANTFGSSLMFDWDNSMFYFEY
ncbi:hypothetical protein ACI75Y_07095 [Capnocytophaga stomatis]|uniref:hypothetical protein n=1 Tax=Capnocytophaga stomatis TaxID=1848904 RepID=UPI00385E5DDC